MAGTQIVKWGNSLAVRIPKPLAEQAGLKEGERVSLQAADGHISVRRSEEIPTLRELVAQIHKQDRYPETATGRERGQEIVEW
jgi:antitoxin MazE